MTSDYDLFWGPYLEIFLKCSKVETIQHPPPLVQVVRSANKNFGISNKNDNELSGVKKVV